MSPDLKEPGFSKSEVHDAPPGVAARVQQAVEPVLNRVQDAYAGAQKTSAQTLENVEGMVKEAPIKALAVTAGAAALAGIVLGFIFRKGSSSKRDKVD